MQPPHPNRFAQELFTGLPARYDLLAELLSLGQNRRWRRAMVDHVVPATPHRILDVATGTAGVALQLARRSPGRIVGVDLTEAMLRRGQENVRRDGAEDRIHLVAGRAEQLPFPD
ncbi:MAG TPA: class I SAM-dependent methyltransferase, partial [Acidimicrobiia bacterium]|nr:class I SAM-dependent methyltransferase [Acidimicrobiia bacterium]